jgi:type II secretory pathway component PulK
MSRPSDRPGTATRRLLPLPHGAARQRPGRGLRSRRGSVLALVLALTVLLAFITVAFISDAKDKIVYDALFHSHEDLRAEAYSALDATLAILHVFHEMDGQLWGPAQGWSDPLALAGYTPPPNTGVTVDFRDESGRFSLAQADFDRLRLVFDQLGFNRALAEELADHLLDWMDEDDLARLNGMDTEDYLKLSPPYRPTNGPLRSWDELALIPPFKEHFWDENGVPRPELATFTSAFSLYHDGPVNINAAPPFVLQVLEEMGVINTRNLADYRAGPDRLPGTADDRVARGTDVGGIFQDPEGSGVAGTASSLLEVSVEVRRGASVFLLRSLVSWRGTQNTASARRAAGEATAAARTSEDPDRDRAARGDTRTATGDAASLGYPFQIFWIAENRQGPS